MKKLACLGIVMLFVVVGMAGMAHAEGLATLKGKVTVAGFTFKCEGAKVTSTCSLSPNPFKPAQKTNSKGIYQWKKIKVTPFVPITGDVTAEWTYEIFGIKLNFEKTELYAFNPFNDGSSNTQTVNIPVKYIP